MCVSICVCVKREIICVHVQVKGEMSHVIWVFRCAPIVDAVTANAALSIVSLSLQMIRFKARRHM